MAVTPSLLAVIDDTLSGASIHSVGVTVAAGATQLFVHAHTSNSVRVTGLTFGSSNLTLIGVTDITNTRTAEAWHLDAPTASTDTVTVTFSGLASCVAPIFTVSGSATANSIGTWIAMPSAATQVVIQSAVGELPIVLVQAQNGSTNSIDDTSSPSLTTIDAREPSASGFHITGLYSGIGASLVTCTFTIFNGGGTKLLGGYSIRPAPVGGVMSPYWLLRKRWDDAAMTT